MRCQLPNRAAEWKEYILQQLQVYECLYFGIALTQGIKRRKDKNFIKEMQSLNRQKKNKGHQADEKKVAKG